jgi:hypothetical protein
MIEEIEKVNAAFAQVPEQKPSSYPINQPPKVPNKANPIMMDPAKTEHHTDGDKPQSTGMNTQAIEFKKQARPTSSKDAQLEIQSAPIKLIAAPTYSFQAKQSSMKMPAVKKPPLNAFSKAIYK